MFGIALGGMAACGGAVPQVVMTALPVETEEPASLPPTLTAEPTHPDFPAGEDLSLYEQAMRPGHEGAVEDFSQVARYWLDLTLGIDPLHIAGQERVRYYNQTGEILDEVVLRLYPNILTGDTALVVQSVSAEGANITWEIQTRDTILHIALEDGLVPGEAIEFDIAFDFTLPPDTEVAYGRMIDLEGVIAAPTFFPLLAVYENGDWQTDWPDDKGDPVYSEVALYDVQLTAPSALKIATTGTALDAEPQPNGTTVYRIVTGPVRDFALAASREFELVSQTLNGVTINVWSAFADDGAQQYALDTGLATVEAFDAYYGEYPYAELDLVESPVSALGIEYPGLVYLTDRIWETPPEQLSLFEWVIVHEIAHQWWYGVVGNDQLNEPWLDEGLAEYSVIVYYRDRVGPRAAGTVRDRYQAEVDQYVEDEGKRMPVGLPTDAYTDREYRVFVYSGGALAHALLAEQFGEEQAQNLLSAAYQQYQFRLVHSGDMERLVEEIMGPEGVRLFREWVYGG